MSLPKPQIALLIDADNAPAAKINAVLAEISKHGVANVRRAYGNWKNASLKPWEDCLHKYAIRPVQQFDYTKGKNATDAALIIDAMDLLYTQNLDAFAIVSSDCDFTPLVMRVLTNGLRVYGFGEQKTPMPFVRACSTFSYLNNKNKTDKSAQEKSARLKQDTKLVQVVRNAITELKEENGWACLSRVGSYISTKHNCTAKQYGYAKLSTFVEAIGLFELRRQNEIFYVKSK